jgi:RNA recognition motif-containing protein
MKNTLGCCTAFAGNLDYNVDDDAMYEFAKDCGEIKELR